MKIKVNSNIYNVSEKELTVKNNRLYNTKTKEYEGVEGDLIYLKYEKDGKIHHIGGSVGGYTCGNHAVIRPNLEYNEVKEKKIEHLMPVTLVEMETEDEEMLNIMTN